MLRQLILDTLIAGPKTTEQLYDAERLYWAYLYASTVTK